MATVCLFLVGMPDLSYFLFDANAPIRIEFTNHDRGFDDIHNYIFLGDVAPPLE